WLSFALEWAHDRQQIRKHSYLGEDIIHLVDAIAADCDPDGAKAALAGVQIPETLPDALARFVETPTVCVHAVSGKAVQQWPLGYFAELIDRLASECAVRVVLIGTAEEEPLVTELLDKIQLKDAVVSAAGHL